MKQAGIPAKLPHFRIATVNLKGAISAMFFTLTAPGFICISRRMLLVKDTSVGKGLFSGGDIRKGDYVCEVTGDITNDLDPEYCNYISYSDDSALDPHSPYRFINHSCEPNCQFMIEESVENGVKEMTVYLEALENISAGDELRTDYGWPADGAIPCKCGKKNCRGWVVAEDELDALVESL